MSLFLNEYRSHQSTHNKYSGHRTMNKSKRLRYEFEYTVQQGFGEPGFNDRLQTNNNNLPLLVAHTSYCVTQSLFLFFNKVLAKGVKKRQKTTEEAQRRKNCPPRREVSSVPRSAHHDNASSDVRLAKDLERRIAQEPSKRRRRESARLSGRKKSDEHRS